MFRLSDLSRAVCGLRCRALVGALIAASALLWLTAVPAATTGSIRVVHPYDLAASAITFEVVLSPASGVAAGGPEERRPDSGVGAFARFGVAAKEAGVAFRANTSHIFRDATGHLAEDTPANRALLHGAVKPENLIGARGPGGSISVYRQTLDDGRQVWVEVRNGTEITNGGVTDAPR